ncbi:hypothetical protein KC326_g226 [Hortaea werneckii]|nr:hypothetical protein KC326_g226 [Hortaea werneckii]
MESWLARTLLPFPLSPFKPGQRSIGLEHRQPHKKDPYIPTSSRKYIGCDNDSPQVKKSSFDIWCMLCSTQVLRALQKPQRLELPLQLMGLILCKISTVAPPSSPYLLPASRALERLFELLYSRIRGVFVVALAKVLFGRLFSAYSSSNTTLLLVYASDLVKGRLRACFSYIRPGTKYASISFVILTRGNANLPRYYILVIDNYVTYYRDNIYIRYSLPSPGLVRGLMPPLYASILIAILGLFLVVAISYMFRYIYANLYAIIVYP